MITFPDHEAFAALYPETSGTLTHGLVDHPLLQLDALVALAGRLDPATVEYNRGNLPVGVDPAAAIGNGLSIAETIAGIESNGSWMVLKFIERDPAYCALLDAALDALLPIVRPRTGAMLKREGFIFVSSPNSVTPFHFDPEHNILCQIRGTKTMNVFPADDDSIVSGAEHERFHMGGHRNTPWHDAFAAKGTAHALTPGDAIYVPVKAPHWVKNGPETSISLSVTWRSEWSFAEADARGMNAVLRGMGLRPKAPGRWPARNRAKALGYRVVRRMRGGG
ncbi:MAG: cupin-like domain-containing protein [Sphingomonadaceae bacterium]